MTRPDRIRYTILFAILVIEAVLQLRSGVTVRSLILILAIVSQLLPVLAVEQLPLPVSPPRFWIWAWSLVFFLSDQAGELVRYLHGRNLWFEMFYIPIADASLLMALSYWQNTPFMRLAYRAGIPIFIVANLALTFLVGEVDEFRSVSGPFRLLVLSAAVVYTLVSRLTKEEGEILRRDWFWACLGTAMYYTAFVIVDPISQALYPEHVELAILVYTVKAAVDVVAFILIWKGMRCPQEASLPSTSRRFLQSS